MSRSTFHVLFYLKRNAAKKDGLVPVMCRITVNGKIAQFSCKLDVDEKLWNVELGRMCGRSITAMETNRKLDKIRVGVNRAYQEVFDTDNYVTAEKVRNSYLGMGINNKALMAVFRQHNEDYEKLVGKMKSRRSLLKYQIVYRHLAEFIKYRYKVNDIALKELEPKFIEDFELYLRVEKNHSQTTLWHYIMCLRSIIHLALNNGWLLQDPFRNYKIYQGERKVEFLTQKEINLLINASFEKPKYELVRDLFLFCTFTGLSWQDMYNLTPENIRESADGHLWIMTHRQKTGVKTSLRLLDIPKCVIEKYEGLAENGKLLPVPAYQNCRIRLQKIAKLCGIEKHFCWHTSRHSFATSVCLSNDVPIETLSKMMGHTNIRSTLIYAKITNDKIDRDMERLSHRIEFIHEFDDCKI